MTKKKTADSTEETEGAEAAEPAVKLTKPKPVKPAAVKRDVALGKGFSAASDLVDAVFTKAKKPIPFVPISSKNMRESLPHISTGSFIIDYLIGGEPNDLGIPPCPGWPLGRVCNLYGPESSGKTTLALLACAEGARRGWPSVYIDWEHAIVPDYARRLGVPVDDDEMFRLYQPDTLEEGIQIAYVFATHKVPIMIFDSVGFAVPTIERERALADRDGSHGQPGIVARAWSRELPQLASEIHKANTLLIAISQLRSSINAMGMGPADTIQGGFVWKYVSSLRLRLKKLKVQEESRFNPLKGAYEPTPVAADIEAKIDKIKIGNSQGRKATFTIGFGIGVDNLRTALDLLQRNKIVTGTGAKLEWTPPGGEAIAAQGKKNFFDKLRANGLEAAFVGQAKSLLQSAVQVGGADDEVADEGSEEDVSEAIKSLG